MANFINNEPKFKVGDKVVYSRRRDFMAGWETESIGKGTLTIKRVDKHYENDELVDVDYWVEGLQYVYSENWLSYAPTGPKFKIGDLVYIHNSLPAKTINEVVTKTYASDGHKEYQYVVKLGPADITFSENFLTPAFLEDTLVHDLEICGGENGCEGCSRKDPDGRRRDGCDKLELDAAELIKKLQKRVKELEEKK